MLQAVRNGASRQIERRLRREWAEYQHEPQIRQGLFGRRTRTAVGPKVSRSLIQINFYKSPRSPSSR